MKKNIIVSILIILFIIIPVFFGIFADLWWFQALEFGFVYMTILMANVYMWSIFFAVLFLFLLANIMLTKSKKKSKKPFIWMALFISIIVAAAFTNWDLLLKFSYSTSFGTVDPVFGNDVSFYTFILPFYLHVCYFAIASVVLSMVFVFSQHVQGFIKVSTSQETEYFGTPETKTSVEWKKLWKHMASHMSFLLFLFLILIGITIWLMKYKLLFSTSGAVFGAAYTDINIWLPLLEVLSILAIIAGIGFLLNRFLKRKSWLILGVFIGIFIVGSAYAGIVQSLNVEPNEFNMEKPYLERNIEYTLKAYNLDKVKIEPFTVTKNLSAEDLANSTTLRNIRLWDWRPLKTTYEQIQLFRTYYEFNDVDTDRYDNRQYVLSARELNFNDLNENAKTWVNKHLVYTHGYGLVMSTVSDIGPDGLPVIKTGDIPPRSESFDINVPQIYYGEMTNNFVVVNTTTKEFDYPKGDENKYTVYNGTSGIKLDANKRLVYSGVLSSLKMLLSSSITDESRLLLHRNIRDRVSKLAPFLAYDNDPYLVVENGKLYWIIDAYTTTSKYPYSEPVGSVNYVRNSVKVVVDAYNGRVDFYVVDEEPVIKTYEKMFPTLFTHYSEMPDYLKKHIRYPEGLFRVQSHIYSNYHMQDPQVFYNKEDAWEIPNELLHGEKTEMEPYYILLKLPKAGNQFVLMAPFTPSRKDNMIAWLAGMSDEPEYGQLVLYKFSKQKLIYGPMQIENRIDQDTAISQLFSLWNQQGSQVIRGNLLVIPIENSILYVEPVYLQAASGGLPELKRVIVAFGDKVVMEKDLATSLSAVFKGAFETEEPETDLIKKANEIYKKAQQALTQGNFSEYANYIEELGNVLGELGQRENT